MQELTKPQVEFNPATLIYDFSILDDQIKIVKETIDKLELTEENIAEIKEYNNALNKLATSLNDEKKRIKANVAPNLKKFEEACMQRVNQLKEIRETTKSFIDDVERIRKENRKAEIAAFYNTLKNECNVPFEVCMRDEFLLKSVTSKKWKADLILNKELVEKEYRRLDDVAVEDKDLLKELFKESWDYEKARFEYDRIKSFTEKQKAAVKETTEAEMPACEEIPMESVTIMICVSGDKAKYEKLMRYAHELGLSVEVV